MNSPELHGIAKQILLATEQQSKEPQTPPPTEEELAALLEGRLSFSRKQECYAWLNRNPEVFSQWVALVEVLHRNDAGVARNSVWVKYFSAFVVPVSALAGVALLALIYFQLPKIISNNDEPVFHLQPENLSQEVFIEELHRLCHQDVITQQDYLELQNLFNTVLNASSEDIREELKIKHGERFNSALLDTTALCAGL